MNTGLTHKQLNISTDRQFNTVQGAVAFKSMLDIDKINERSISKYLTNNIVQL